MSRICPKCGKAVSDQAVFCNNCGTAFQAQQNFQQGYYQQGQQGYQQQGYQQQGYQQNQSSYAGFHEIIVDADEKVKMILQNSYAQTAVTDLSLGSTKVFFTDKRFYAKENQFTLSRGLITKNTVVELSEISGTAIVHENPFHLFIYAGIYFLFALIFGALAGSEGLVLGLFTGLFFAGLFTALYFLRKGTYLRVSFSGDTAMIRVRMYNYNCVVTFLKGLQKFLYHTKN